MTTPFKGSLAVYVTAGSDPFLFFPVADWGQALQQIRECRTLPEFSGCRYYVRPLQGVA